MSSPRQHHADAFDALYARTRTPLLWQTYALTGDLPAAQQAVRACFVEAWHHWRTVAALDDPETWLRPRAWAHAQRRHSARPWYRARNADPEVAATLAALSKLTGQQRRMLLLTHLVPGSLAEHARELGMTQSTAERELQLATSEFALRREVQPAGIGATLEALQPSADEARWPRATIIRRSGSQRRRSHVVMGSLVALAAVVASGALVTDVQGVQPTLSGQELTEPTKTPSGGPTSGPSTPPEAVELTGAALLGEDQLARLGPQDWRITRTGSKTQGKALVLPCQPTRFADDHSEQSLVRTFTAGDAEPATRPEVVQTAEVSRDAKAARRGYRTTRSWFAACTDERTQLLATYDVGGVGQGATLFTLRWWGTPARTEVVGVARTGRTVTVTSSVTTSTARPEIATHAALLAAAVNGLCGQPGTGRCASPPLAEPREPLPASAAPGMLGEVDLPPAIGVTEPWVGTEPRKATLNAAATSCDKTTFTGAGISSALTRTFLVPGDDSLPKTFGLTQTVGVMREAQARTFVAGVRKRIVACGNRNLGTKVEPLLRRTSEHEDISVWRLLIEVDDETTVPVLMAVARDRTAVTQLGFFPALPKTFRPGAFVALAERALDRLPRMPHP